jgi:hypothetical protein
MARVCRSPQDDQRRLKLLIQFLNFLGLLHSGHPSRVATIIWLLLLSRARPGGGWLRGGRGDRFAAGANRLAAWPYQAEREPLPALR